MTRFQIPKTEDWKTLSRNDWGEILELSKKKTYQRKFQIVEAFIRLAAEKGYDDTTHTDIAKACKVTRQLVDHHFPNNRILMLLTYRYIYARFQKHAADSIAARESTLSRFNAYVTSMSTWIRDYKYDARFLTNFYGIAPVYPELFSFHERNTLLGQERIQTLLIQLREEKKIAFAPDETLLSYATSVQHQIIGFIILKAGLPPPSASEVKKRGEELWRSSFTLVGGKL